MTKLIQEVSTIISSNDTISTKVVKLQNVETNSRPGREEAEKMIYSYLHKVVDKRNKLREKSLTKIAGFVKRKNEYTYLKGSSQTSFQVSGKRIIHYTPYVSDLSSAKSSLLAYKKQKFVKYIQGIIPEKMYGTVMNIVGRPEEVSLTDRNNYRSKALKAVEELQDFYHTGLSFDFYGKQANVIECQENGPVSAYKTKRMYAKAGDTYFVVDQDEEISWDKYSKSWHNTYGPHREITRRYARVYKGGTQVATIDFKSFSGNYLINGVAEYLKMQPVKVAKDLKSVQLNPLYAVEKLHQIAGSAIYRRTFGGETVDFCAVSQNITFHASTPSAAIKGLRNKISAAAKAEADRVEAENRILTAEICREQYGFCTTGIKSFCELNGLDYQAAYTVREIRSAVVKNRSENCLKFKKELKTIGIALNCK